MSEIYIVYEETEIVRGGNATSIQLGNEPQTGSGMLERDSCQGICSHYKYQLFPGFDQTDDGYGYAPAAEMNK